MVKKRCRKRRRLGDRGQSAVFDAVLFFIILISASVFIYIVPSNLVKQNEDILQSQYRNEFVDSTLRAVLKSTVGSTTYQRDGMVYEVFDIDVLSAIKLYSELKLEHNKGSNLDLTALRMEIADAFNTAKPSDFNFCVNVTYVKGSDALSEVIVGENALKSTKYSSNFEVDLGDTNLLIVLSIWS